MPEAVQPFALFGGGRWSQVLLGEILDLLPLDQRLVWVSGTDPSDRHSFLERKGFAQRVLVATEFREAFNLQPQAVVIATDPLRHPGLCMAALDAGAHVLIEKPIALSVQAAKQLCQHAKRCDRVLFTDLVFRTAPFLKLFAQQFPSTPEKIRLDWLDPAKETRHQTKKTPRLGTPLIWDVYPHVWSIAKALGAAGDGSVSFVRTQTDGGLALSVMFEGTELHARLGRRATRRIRSVAVSSGKFNEVALDFAHEPGIIHRHQEGSIPLPSPRARPLATVLSAFLYAARNGVTRHPLSASMAMGAIVGAETAQTLRANDDTARIAHWLKGSDSLAPAALEEIVIDRLAAKGSMPANWQAGKPAEFCARLRQGLTADDCHSPAALSERLTTLFSEP